MANPEKNVILTFDTFRPIGAYEQSNLQLVEPSCFTGILRIQKYRVTIEKIEEPVFVIEERLQKLWDECRTHQHWGVLQNAAKKIGYELKGSAGNALKKT